MKELTEKYTTIINSIPSSIKMFMTANRVKLLAEINNASEYVYIGHVIRTMEVVKVHVRSNMRNNVLKDLEPVYIFTDNLDLKSKIESLPYIIDLRNVAEEIKDETNFKMIESKLS
jgi:hypothetical protein